MRRLNLAYWVGKWVVRLHYKQKLDVYSLTSIHAPELYARGKSKQKIPVATRWHVWRRDNFTCVYCGAWGQNLSLDHVIPEKHGGTFETSNLVTACTKCNVKKGARSFEAFVSSRWLRKKRKQNFAGTPEITSADLRAEILARVEKG